MQPLSNMTGLRFVACFLLMGLFLGGCDDSSDVSEPESDLSQETEESVDLTEEEEGVVSDEALKTEPTETKLEIEYSEKQKTSEGLHWIVEETESGEFWVNVTAVELKDVFGIAFHLTYDSSVIQYVEGQSTEILRNNQAEVATLFRPDSDVVRFGTVRLHEPMGGGQGINYTGLDVPKGVIAKFKFAVVSAGETDLQITQEGLDIRNADLKPMSISISGSDVSIAEVEVQP